VASIKRGHRLRRCDFSDGTLGDPQFKVTPSLANLLSVLPFFERVFHESFTIFYSADSCKRHVGVRTDASRKSTNDLTLLLVFTGICRAEMRQLQV